VFALLHDRASALKSAVCWHSVPACAASCRSLKPVTRQRQQRRSSRLRLQFGALRGSITYHSQVLHNMSATCAPSGAPHRLPSSAAQTAPHACLFSQAYGQQTSMTQPPSSCLSGATRPLLVTFARVRPATPLVTHIRTLTRLACCPTCATHPSHTPSDLRGHTAQLRTDYGQRTAFMAL
jgi:hypothetical protein